MEIDKKYLLLYYLQSFNEFFFLGKFVTLYNLLVVYCYNNFSKIYNLNYIGSLNDRVITQQCFKSHSRRFDCICNYYNYEHRILKNIPFLYYQLFFDLSTSLEREHHYYFLISELRIIDIVVILLTY